MSGTCACRSPSVLRLPGDQASRHADLVICNGGSTTGYQALQNGKPVLGIPSNLDQYLCMAGIESAGAGILLGAGRVTEEAVRAAVESLLEGGEFLENAKGLSRKMEAYRPEERFGGFLREVMN